MGLIGIVGMVLVIFLTSRGPASSTDRQLALGREVYDANCAACHGLQGEGQIALSVPAGQNPAPPHDSTGHTWHHPDAQLIAVTTNGGISMPAFGGTLSDEEIAASLAYIKTFWTEEQRLQQAGLFN
jgi:mono/diheme cytochrome c family protein